MNQRTLLFVGANSQIARALHDSLAGSGPEILRWTRSDELEGTTRVEDLLESELPELPERLDGLAYFPGTLTLTPFERVSLDDFRRDWEISVLGLIRVLQHAMPALKKGNEASVAAVSTVAASNGLAFHTSVAQAKAGVEGLIRSLAAEYAPKIRFNAVAPSLTDTPMAERLLNSDAKREKMDARHPLQRVGTAEDVAQAMEFLLSPRSSWITGQVIGVDGGFGRARG